jgi:hypothetical protein
MLLVLLDRKVGKQMWLKEETDLRSRLRIAMSGLVLPYFCFCICFQELESGNDRLIASLFNL